MRISARVYGYVGALRKCNVEAQRWWESRAAESTSAVLPSDAQSPSFERRSEQRARTHPPVVQDKRGGTTGRLRAEANVPGSAHRTRASMGTRLACANRAADKQCPGCASCMLGAHTTGRVRSSGERHGVKGARVYGLRRRRRNPARCAGRENAGLQARERGRNIKEMRCGSFSGAQSRGRSEGVERRGDSRREERLGNGREGSHRRRRARRVRRCTESLRSTKAQRSSTRTTQPRRRAVHTERTELLCTKCVRSGRYADERTSVRWRWGGVTTSLSR
jgi:hypothetical protein